jgi:hypothetical protein
VVSKTRSCSPASASEAERRKKTNRKIPAFLLPLFFHPDINMTNLTIRNGLSKQPQS